MWYSFPLHICIKYLQNCCDTLRWYKRLQDANVCIQGSFRFKSFRFKIDNIETPFYEEYSVTYKEATIEGETNIHS